MARISKNEQQNIRRARNVEGWRSLGIAEKIITQYDLRNKNPNPKKPTAEQLQFKQTVKTASRVYKTKVTKEKNAKRRYWEYKKHGYSDEEIKKSWLASDKKMREILNVTDVNRVYNAKSYLGIAFTNLHGATAIFDTSKYKRWSFEKIKKAIHKRVAQSNANPDGSDHMSCIFQLFAGSEDYCDYMLDEFSQRGYKLSIKKLTDRRYYRLVNRNDWTMREYAEMMLCVLQQCHNKDVPHLIDEFRDFVEENDLPFNEIFN